MIHSSLAGQTFPVPLTKPVLVHLTDQVPRSGGSSSGRKRSSIPLYSTLTEDGITVLRPASLNSPRGLAQNSQRATTLGRGSPSNFRFRLVTPTGYGQPVASTHDYP